MSVHDRSSFENLYAGQPRWTKRMVRRQTQIVNVTADISGSIRFPPSCMNGSWPSLRPVVEKITEIQRQKCRKEAPDRGKCVKEIDVTNHG